MIIMSSTRNCACCHIVCVTYTGMCVGIAHVSHVLDNIQYVLHIFLVIL